MSRIHLRRVLLMGVLALGVLGVVVPPAGADVGAKEKFCLDLGDGMTFCVVEHSAHHYTETPSGNVNYGENRTAEVTITDATGAVVYHREFRDNNHYSFEDGQPFVMSDHFTMKTLENGVLTCEVDDYHYANGQVQFVSYSQEC